MSLIPKDITPVYKATIGKGTSAARWQRPVSGPADVVEHAVAVEKHGRRFAPSRTRRSKPDGSERGAVPLVSHSPARLVGHAMRAFGSGPVAPASDRDDGGVCGTTATTAIR